MRLPWEWSVMMVDVGEMEIERPKKNKNATILASKSVIRWRHNCTRKFETGHIICTAALKGKMHDFKLLKRSRLPFVPLQLCLADRGYQGFAKLHRGACIPTKKPRKQPLPTADKQHNRALARLRVRALAREFGASKFFASFLDAIAIVESGSAYVWILLRGCSITNWHTLIDSCRRSSINPQVRSAIRSFWHNVPSKLNRVKSGRSHPEQPLALYKLFYPINSKITIFFFIYWVNSSRSPNRTKKAVIRALVYLSRPFKRWNNSS